METDSQKIPETEEECLSVDLVNEVDVFSGGVEDIADQVALRRVPGTQALVVRHDALFEMDENKSKLIKRAILGFLLRSVNW